MNPPLYMRRQDRCGFLSIEGPPRSGELLDSRGDR